MKGIVFQVEGRDAVIMKPGGEFIRLPAEQGWQAGDIVTIRRARPNLHMLHVLAACIALVASLCAGGYHFYFTQTALISMDINPSVEFGLNRFDRVISLTAHNPEAENIIKSANIINTSYTDAVKLLIADERLSRYIADNSYILFAVQASGEGRQDAILDNLQSAADSAVLPYHENINMEYYAVDSQTVLEAHRHGMTAGKYIAVLELRQVAPYINISEYSHCTVEEIKGEIQSHSGHREHDPAESGNAHGHGSQHH